MQKYSVYKWCSSSPVVFTRTLKYIVLPLRQIKLDRNFREVPILKVTCTIEFIYYVNSCFSESYNEKNIVSENYVT